MPLVKRESLQIIDCRFQTHGVASSRAQPIFRILKQLRSDSPAPIRRTHVDRDDVSGRPTVSHDESLNFFLNGVDLCWLDLGCIHRYQGERSPVSDIELQFRF